MVPELSARGLLVQYGPYPLHLIFVLLTAVFTLGLAAVLVIPDVVERRPGWLSSIRPQIGVPPASRALFVAFAPSLIATWALGGLYLSLGPSLAGSLLPVGSHAGGGLVIRALLGAGAAASVRVRTSDPRAIVIKGSAVLLVGVAITLVGVLAIRSWGCTRGA